MISHHIFDREYNNVILNSNRNNFEHHDFQSIGPHQIQRINLSIPITISAKNNYQIMFSFSADNGVCFQSIDYQRNTKGWTYATEAYTVTDENKKKLYHKNISGTPLIVDGKEVERYK